MNKEELIKELKAILIKVRRGDMITPKIYQILELLKAQNQEQYKKGYNQCLKDQKLTGEKHQHLYL